MLEAYDQTQLFPTECQTDVVSFCLTKPSPWPAKRRSNHFQTWMKRSTKSWTSIQSVCWKSLTLKLKHPLLSRFLLTRTEAKVPHAMSSRESQGTPITSFHIRLDVGQRLPSKQVNQCIQDAGVGFINAAKTLKGPERHCIHCIYLIVLYFTLICWMPRAWQNRKVIAWWAKRQQLHHNVQTPWFTKWDPQSQSKKAASSIAPTEWFRGFREPL